MHQRLERELCAFLGVEHFALVSNGTLALEGAIAALGITENAGGEVITSPYSFVATAHAIRNAGLKPVFADIAAGSPNLDPDAARAAISPNTKAIIPIHCYGLPCDVQAFEDISTQTGIPVIYDAAHAFGVEHNGQSLLRYGDAATLSFHGTKVFNTFEGGGIVFASAEAKERCMRWRNFGYVNETTIGSAGTNAKVNEICAAMGLASLPHYPAAHQHRANIDHRYRKLLANLNGIECLPKAANFAYFPVEIAASYGLDRDEVYDKLVAAKIFVRRYFYPLITDFDFFAPHDRANESFPNAAALSRRVICLPIHPDLPLEHVDKIVDVLTDI